MVLCTLCFCINAIETKEVGGIYSTNVERILAYSLVELYLNGGIMNF
jgi:hypothetical protein